MLIFTKSRMMLIKLDLKAYQDKTGYRVSFISTSTNKESLNMVLEFKLKSGSS